MKKIAVMLLALGVLGGGAQVALSGSGCCPGAKKAEDKKDVACCTADKSCADKSKCADTSKCSDKAAEVKADCSATKS